MSTTRLTNQMRETILVRANKFKFTELDKRLETQNTELGDALYLHEYGLFSEKARALPREWLVYDDTIIIKCQGEYALEDVTLSKEQPWPSAASYNTNHVDVKIDHPFYKSVKALWKATGKLEAEKKEFRLKLRNLLRSATTLNKLAEAWPEGKQFYADLQPTPHYPIVSATLIHEINRMLGLEPIPNLVRDTLVKAAKT